MTDSNDNFALALDATCAANPAGVALHHRGRALDYGELAALVDRWAALLHARGLGPGGLVTLWLPNSPDFVAAYFATLRLGGVAVPLGVLLRPREVRQRLELAPPIAVVTTPTLAEALGDCGVDVLSTDSFDAGASTAVRLPATARAADDLAVLIFTSGTTGAAKAAELTHRGVAWNARALADAFALTAHDVQLAVAPFSHVLGMTGVMNATLTTGGAIALVERFDPAATLALMTQTRTTGVMGAPPMFAALLREAATAEAPPAFRFAHGGGAPFPAELARRVSVTFGCVVRQGYGMSEVGGAVTLVPEEPLTKPQSVGMALPGSRVRTVDLTTGAPLPAGQRGEVQVNSPSVMRGYRGDAEATRAVLDVEGWLSTGDIGYLDADGHLFLVDRKKELIIRSGYNVYPREVEEVLLSCPGVLEVAVLGLADEEHGEEVVALVVPERNDLDVEGVKAFARERLAAYKYPRHIVLVAELPKGPTGKIAKREIDLRALLARR